MKTFFEFDSVAIFGVSPSPTNLALGFIHNLVRLNYDGRIYAVGKRTGQVKGIPIHTSLDEIDDPIELAVLLVPARDVPATLEACGRKGIRRAIIESGGFSEFTGEDRLNDEQLLEIARRFQMRFLGPNCIGTVNVRRGINLDFSSNGEMPPPGPVGIIAQSGGITLWFANICAEKGLGLSLAASIGNKLNVNEEDLLEHYLQDADVRGVLCYLESIADGPRLMHLARGSKKPIVIYKSNTSPSSQRIAASHTAAILSDDRVVDQAFRQAGIWRVHDAHELDVAMRALQLKPCRGNRIFVVARSGGHAVMAADAAARHGFELVEPPKEFLRQLENVIPTTRITRQNPLDIGDVFELWRCREVVRAALAIENLDAVVFLYLLTARERAFADKGFFEEFVQIANEAPIPIVLGYFLQGHGPDALLHGSSGTIFETPDDAIDALAVNRDFWRRKTVAQRVTESAPLNADRGAVREALGPLPAGTASPSDSFRIAGAYGIPTAPWKSIPPGGDLIGAAEELGFPVVLKLDAREVSHKSDLGFVRLSLGDVEALGTARREMLGRYRDLPGGKGAPGLLVMKQIDPGLEVIVGARRDPTFGPVVVFGLGGVMVEILASVAMRILPVDEAMALEMIAQVRGAELLESHRGRPALDKRAVADVILRVARLMEEHPRIGEVDLNPVIVTPARAMAVDARIILTQPLPEG